MSVGPYRNVNYVVLPACVDPYGHHFELAPGATLPVCRKCGLVRNAAAG
jgi:hypothetical protein